MNANDRRLLLFALKGHGVPIQLLQHLLTVAYHEWIIGESSENEDEDEYVLRLLVDAAPCNNNNSNGMSGVGVGNGNHVIDPSRQLRYVIYTLYSVQYTVL